jgi:hypothetical protein
VRAALVALAAGSLLLVFAVVTEGGERKQRVLRTNLTPPVAFTNIAKGGKTVCQIGETVPGDAGALRFRIGTYGRPGPPLTVTITGRGEPARRGTLPEGWQEGDVEVPVGRAARDRSELRVCVRNGGTRRIAFAGNSRSDAGSASIGRRDTGGRMWIAYLEPAPRSLWDELGRVDHRVAVVRDAVPGGATLALWGLLAIVVAAGSAIVVVREARK